MATNTIQWFKFSPAAWLMGRIQRRPENVQVAFLRLLCKYWHNECFLSTEEAELECGTDEYKELLKHKLIKSGTGILVEDKTPHLAAQIEVVKIEFLDEQWADLLDLKAKNSEKGKRSADIKKQIKGAEISPNTHQQRLTVVNNGTTADESGLTEHQPQPTDKIRIDKIREDKIEIREENNNTIIISDEIFEIPKPYAGNLYKSMNDVKIVLINSKSWCDVICMHNSIKPEKLPEWIETFYKHALTQGKDYITTQPFQEHFSNWIKKQDIYPANNGVDKAPEAPVKESAIARRNRLLKEQEQKQ